jgi:hypothetical protein
MHDRETAIEAIKSAEYRRKTLHNLRFFAEPVEPPAVSTSIWYFQTKGWVKWAPEEGKNVAGELLW